MKKTLVISAVALSLSSSVLAGGLPEVMPIAPAAASDMGVYFGLQGGFGMTHWKDIGKDISKDNGFVGRAFTGVDFTRNLAVELGYSWFTNQPKLTTTDGNNSTTTDKLAKNTMAIDLMLKLKAPVVEGFDLYGKVGPAFMMSRSDAVGNKNNLTLAFAFGADYVITEQLIANAEFMRINGRSKLNDKYQPHADAFLLGLRYKIEL